MNIAITAQRLGNKAMALVTAMRRVRPIAPFSEKFLSL